MTDMEAQAWVDDVPEGSAIASGVLREIEQRVLWLSTAMIDHANRVRPNVSGMKVGGRRKLVIPAALAYGDRGAGGVIKPGEALIFVVDLVDVH